MSVFSPMRSSSRFGQAVPALKTAFAGFDCATRVSKAGHGNDKAWKAKKPAFHPSHTLWKSLRDYHIPTASTAGISAYLKMQNKERPNPRPLDHNGVVMEVAGPKCNGCSGTLTPD